jgi:dTDP-4-dehydrorhamnose 3,5-epimerase
MNWIEGEIVGVIIRAARRHTDQRGWLAEMFRSDEMPADMLPAMSYVSVTHPGISRGPHGHLVQTDVFGFVGPGNFRLKLWDNRPGSPTYGHRVTLIAGEEDPQIVVVPPGIAHGYTNISAVDGWVLNYPNRLFAGQGRKDPIDEVRYEDLSAREFSMED